MYYIGLCKEEGTYEEALQALDESIAMDRSLSKLQIRDFQSRSELLEEEQLYERLLDSVLQSPGLYTLRQYDDVLDELYETLYPVQPNYLRYTVNLHKIENGSTAYRMIRWLYSRFLSLVFQCRQRNNIHAIFPLICSIG